jgi:hypothetical protein
MISGANLTTIEKGLIDMLVPLNDENNVEKRRALALKQGYIKWLGSWNLQEAMMSSNYVPERNLQFTNALSFIDNAIIRDGKIVNIRQWLQIQERYRYTEMPEAQRRQFEKGLNKRVDALKKAESLAKVAKIVNDEVVIPGVSASELARFRTQIVEWNRNLNGQMSADNRANYRRDTILKSMSMFRNWIPKQVSIRGHDIKYNLQVQQWEYGRTRAFMKAWVQLGLKSTFRMIDIIQGTDKGLSIMDQMIEEKKIEYYKKNGVELTITKEEFYDMMRRALVNEMKEIGMLLGLINLVLAAKAAAPDREKSKFEHNRYKYFLKAIGKISNEVDFYYNPMSFVSMTKGNFIPAMGTVVTLQKAIIALGKETYGYTIDDQKMIDKAHPTKYFMDIVPVVSQFEKEWLPLIAPDLATHLGIIVNPQPRPEQ